MTSGINGFSYDGSLFLSYFYGPFLSLLCLTMIFIGITCSLFILILYYSSFLLHVKASRPLEQPRSRRVKCRENFRGYTMEYKEYPEYGAYAKWKERRRQYEEKKHHERKYRQRYLPHLRMEWLMAVVGFTRKQKSIQIYQNSFSIIFFFGKMTIVLMQTIFVCWCFRTLLPVSIKYLATSPFYWSYYP